YPKTSGVITLKLSVHHEPIRISDMSLACVLNSPSLRKTQAIKTTSTSPSIATPNWLIKETAASRQYNTPSVAKISDTTPARPPPNKTAFVLDILNLSAKPAIYVSHIDISEVKPARTSDAKNKNPNNPFNAGNSFMIAGKTTNASPTPSATTSSTLTPA